MRLTWLRIGAALALGLSAPAAGATAGRPLTGSTASVDLALPDAFTAILVRPIAAKTAAFQGDDDRFHIVYELLLTNAKALPATFDRIDVLDAAEPSRVLRTLTGAELLDRTVNLNAQPAADTSLALNESKAVMVELAFDSAAQVPVALLHRLEGTGAAHPASAVPGPLAYLVAPWSLTEVKPPVIGAPLTGRGWVAANGCCLARGPHRGSLQAINGVLDNSQRFAIDWLQLDDQGRFVVGDPDVLENWVGFGQPLVAVADGVVVKARNDLDDQPPGQLPDPLTITVDTVDGNHVVLDIGHGLFAFYAHFKKGSVTVQAGDRVSAGQLLGQLGNSGNSSAPHLHLHVIDGPSPLGSLGIPYAHKAFVVAGQVDPVLFDTAPDLTGTWGNRGQVPVRSQSNRLPLNLSIVDWPSPQGR